MNPQATAGRIVHYQQPGEPFPRAAMVNIDTHSDGMAPELTLFNSGGTTVFTSVPYSEEPAMGCWSWMPYQKEKAETERGNESESAE